MINPIDAMEYTKAIEGKMGFHHKEYALIKIKELYLTRIK